MVIGARKASMRLAAVAARARRLSGKTTGTKTGKRTYFSPYILSQETVL
jgi:hypothetical protein